MTPVAPQTGAATAGSDTADARGAAEAMDVDTAGKLTQQQPASRIYALAASCLSVCGAACCGISVVVLQPMLIQAVALCGCDSIVLDTAVAIVAIWQ